ncbi:hypothetical protein F2P81_018942 [Scophthalmus maximus]|uniref:Uncharacterized protein n=1 Tax=Scophthalmus maximus TaxID=52904 RepID=A0A6A4S9J1_SCOMX|nr:hypothetical protein F2P81_018942 [Scophthalmus maximus]
MRSAVRGSRYTVTPLQVNEQKDTEHPSAPLIWPHFVIVEDANFWPRPLLLTAVTNYTQLSRLSEPRQLKL